MTILEQLKKLDDNELIMLAKKMLIRTNELTLKQSELDYAKAKHDVIYNNVNTAVKERFQELTQDELSQTENTHNQQAAQTTTIESNINDTSNITAENLFAEPTTGNTEINSISYKDIKVTEDNKQEQQSEETINFLNNLTNLNNSGSIDLDLTGGNK
jgi:hypothetical protein